MWEVLKVEMKSVLMLGLNPSSLIEFSEVHVLPTATLTQRGWPVGRQLSCTASVAVNIGEEFILPWWSPSFILAGQHLPKSSHSLEQMSLASWRAGEGPPDTEGQLRFSLDRKARPGRAGSWTAADRLQALFCT